MIGKMPEQPTADRPYDETNCKQHSGIQLLYNGIISGKKGTGEIQRECRVCIKIVPLDKITDRPNENRLEPAPYIGNLKVSLLTAMATTSESPSGWINCPKGEGRHQGWP